MKKKILIVVGVILIIVVLSVSIFLGYRWYSNNQLSEIDKEILEYSKLINNNSNLPIEYLSKHDRNNPILDNYEYIPNFMSNDYWNDDIKLEYIGFPNDMSDRYLGIITLLSNKYNILGVTVGDTFDEAKEKITKYGFVNEDYRKFTYKKLTITLEDDWDYTVNNPDDDTMYIKSMKLEVHSEYTGEVLY